MLVPEYHGVILLGHGSREPGTETEIRALCDDLAARVGDRSPAATPHRYLFAHAFLNQEPRLEAAAETLVAAGCKHVLIVPLLVFIGRHVIDDVPAALERLRTLHPGVAFAREPHLFRLPGFSDLIADTVTRTPAEERSA